MNRTYRDVLDIAARPYVPDELDLFPRIAARLERKTFIQTLRARPALAILIVLVALSLLTGIAYAVGRSLGYIPGVGLVEDGAPVRTLAEPVTQTRQGVTLTVTDVVLTVDQTVVLFSLEGVPWQALSHEGNVPGCSETPYIRLSDGKSLSIREGGGGPTKARFVYSAIPKEISEAIFVIPCIQSTLPGKAPEDWEVLLRFAPAPPDMTIVPVVDLPTPTRQAQATNERSSVSLEKGMQLGDQYVLVGKLDQQSGIDLTAYSLTDANGNEVFFTRPTIEGLPAYDWGLQFNGATIDFPITVRFTGRTITSIPDATAEFDFDVGEDPQPDQVWKLGLPIHIGRRMITLETVRVSSRDGYVFTFACDTDSDMTGLSLKISGYTAVGGGGGATCAVGQFSVSQAYSELPKGNLHVVLSNLRVASPPQTWTIEWSPENPLESVPLYGISLVVDKFVPLDDGYYLIGHIEWADERIAVATEYGTMQAFDATGHELPLEKVRFAEAKTLVPDLQADQWVYRLHGSSFDGPLTLRLSQVNVEFKQPVRFTLDLRTYGFTFSEDQIGVPWKTGLLPLDVPGLNVSLARAAYVREGSRYGFEFALEADNRLQKLALDFEEGITDEQDPRAYETRRDQQNGLLLVTVLTDGRLSMPISIVARGGDVTGGWETNWEPPVSNSR